MSDGANQEAPQASQLRLARRRPEFYGQAHERRDLVQLPCSPRSDVAHAALNSTAAQAPVAHELVKELAFHKLCLLLLRVGGGGRTKGGNEAGEEQSALPPSVHPPPPSPPREKKSKQKI